MREGQPREPEGNPAAATSRPETGRRGAAQIALMGEQHGEPQQIHVWAKPQEVHASATGVERVPVGTLLNVWFEVDAPGAPPTAEASGADTRKCDGVHALLYQPSSSYHGSPELDPQAEYAHDLTHDPPGEPFNGDSLNLASADTSRGAASVTSGEMSNPRRGGLTGSSWAEAGAQPTIVAMQWLEEEMTLQRDANEAEEPLPSRPRSLSLDLSPCAPLQLPPTTLGLWARSSDEGTSASDESTDSPLGADWFALSPEASPMEPAKATMGAAVSPADIGAPACNSKRALPLIIPSCRSSAVYLPPTWYTSDLRAARTMQVIVAAGDDHLIGAR